MRDNILDRIRAMAVGEHMQEKIRFGYPELAWPGDPWATLCYNKILDCYELWYEKDKPVILMRSKPGEVPSVEELCVHLRDHDLSKWSEHAIMKRVDEHNAAITRAVEAKHRDRANAALEKAYWYVAKEIGEHKPVISMHGKKA